MPVLLTVWGVDGRTSSNIIHVENNPDDNDRQQLDIKVNIQQPPDSHQLTQLGTDLVHLCNSTVFLK